ncbi:class I SAM-dependent methyltransferase [Aspergillus undulatus]|uniref:class I SAM-dependent methyltransferase n=1 Tax=Aspergillus undulatus TaxID=1810928 RepID=UPI003CCCAA13
MSAVRLGRSAAKAAKGTVSTQRTPKNTKPSPATRHISPLPKRANPLLSNLNPTPETRMPPRTMTILGVSVLAMSTYCGYLYTSYRREVSQAQSMTVPEDVSDRYNHTAQTFDADVEMSEKLMRMGAKRRDLVQRAKGDVLEVSCGTGRNLEYYGLGEKRGVDVKGRVGVRGCRSVTFVDLSPEMVAVARGKFERLHPGLAESERVQFRAQDARDVPPPSKESLSSSQGYYDTIVQTMGLCSMPEPAEALKHLGSITEPQEGRILLLEHGRSHYDWLNRVLDNLAPAHADRHGCWWNRDIGQIVRDSGLEIVEQERWHFGTTWRRSWKASATLPWPAETLCDTLRGISGKGTLLMKQVLQAGECDTVPEHLLALEDQMNREWPEHFTPEDLRELPDWTMKKYFVRAGDQQPDRTRTTAVVGTPFHRGSEYRAGNMRDAASNVEGLYHETAKGPETQTTFMG